jgi:serralysin
LGENVLYGIDGNDKIYGGSGNEWLIDGGAGNDSINGGAGHDKITGGTGADSFIYLTNADSGTGSGNRDVINDFNSTESDKIDLSSFTGTFTFKGTSAFDGGGIHEVNYISNGGTTVISVDSEGNGTADF